MPGNLQPLVNNQRIVNNDGTPTDYFIRWAQQKQIDISSGITAEQAQQLIDEAFAQLQIIGVDEISVTGSYANPPISISWAAGLGNLDDVDLGTPPTDGQVLGYVASGGKWVPVDQTGGGGGGGGGHKHPTLVQEGYLRNDGVLALPTAPTAGNFLVVLTAGYSGSLPSYGSNLDMPLIGRYDGDSNNAVMGYGRVAVVGDTGSYSMNAADNQASWIGEFSNAAAMWMGGGGPMPYAGSNFTDYIAESPFGEKDVAVGMYEIDGTDTWTIPALTGFTEMHQTGTGSGNHTSVVWRIDLQNFIGPVTGSLGSGPSGATKGMFFVVGAVDSSGGGGNWWFDPPAAADFALASGDASQLTLTDDADVGLMIDAGPAVGGDIERIAYKTLTDKTKDWELVARLDILMEASDFSQFGICCRDSIGGRLMIGGMHNYGQNFLTYFNSLNAGNSNQSTLLFRTDMPWYRFRRIGGTLYLDYSVDGKDWFAAWNAGITAFLANEPDQIGLGVTYNRGSGRRTYASCGNFRLTGPAV